MAEELDTKIVKQLEYYFGDINLPRDRFLKEKTKEKDGWVALDVMLSFKRLASICDDAKIIAAAVENSGSKLLELSEDKTEIRRSPEEPLPELNEDRKKQLMERSAYAKGFPIDSTLTDILEFLEPHGPVESVIKRSRDRRFKGSCFIVFKDVETAKKFVEVEGLKYKDVELVRKMQNDYHADKKKEIEERKKLKKDKREALNEEASTKLEFPKGAILYFSGIPEDKSLTREELKERMNEVGGLEVSYIDYNKGDIEGYARFGKEGQAAEFMKKLTDDTFEIGDIKIKVETVEGEKETEYLKKTSEAIIKIRSRNRFNRKRKGNFNSGGRNNKQQKKNKDDKKQQGDTDDNKTANDNNETEKTEAEVKSA